MSEPIAGAFVAAGDLNERERAVTRLVAAGLSNREIGERLGIRVPTVKDHLWAVREKLRARNRAHLAAIATRHGLDRSDELDARDDRAAAESDR